ncbi:hypothetical protein EG329_011956 [Mollisiaceae sp. DMI_Dod_QoI]|nr:hypothetical protein EG329_011956 [Helotiales sp. DMI_Dod_QoI]
MSLTSFPIFRDLPSELRLKIWALAANASPRTLDIWTDFKRCEIGNTIFYTQAYHCEISNTTPPPILRVSSEARSEAQKHYTLEFATGMAVSSSISVTIHPKIYINYATDTLIPRGYWNIISFAHFVSRAGGRLKHLAVDVNGVFWKENMKDYSKKGCLTFPELDELILYDSSQVEIFKEGDDLERFKENHKDGKRDLSFQDLNEEPSQQLTEVQTILEKMFDKIEGKVEEAEIGEDGEPIPATPEVYPNYMDDCEPSKVDKLQRPLMRLTELLATKPTTH